LLLGALRRLTSGEGDPVVELQTNFGGGKTHSLLALYHLFSQASAPDLVGVEPLLQEVGLVESPPARRAVLVGHALSPARVDRKPDGCEVHTLWGELAWQLLGKEGYEMIAEEDRRGVSPGSDLLRQLFAAASPALILIDEWVVFVRQLYGKEGLPAGSFEGNLSFAQNLTEAAKASPRTLVVATIPAAENEVGGEGGMEAVSHLKSIFGRIESPWRPADREEGFEIVRRRLFDEIPAHLYATRDATASAFSDYYRSQRHEFPGECSEAGYEQRIKNCYPIHPELFDRLFSDWSSIPHTWRAAPDGRRRTRALDPAGFALAYHARQHPPRRP
jgi:predicted AAA+ superfamily ATPase